MCRTFLYPLAAILLSALAACASSPDSNIPAQASSIATSREGRPLTASTCGSGPRRVYLIAGIHGDEREGHSTRADLRRVFQNSHTVTLRLLDDMNPDGSAAGSRTNAARVDLNRNWPAKNFKPARNAGPTPHSEPETAGVDRDIAFFDPHLIIVLHSSPRGPFVNFDGPASSLAAAFTDAARASDRRWRVVADMGYPTPGSMGSYFGRDHALPILTIELQRHGDTKASRAAVLSGVRAACDALSADLLPLSRRTSQR